MSPNQQSSKLSRPSPQTNQTHKANPLSRNPPPSPRVLQTHSPLRRKSPVDHLYGAARTRSPHTKRWQLSHEILISRREPGIEFPYHYPTKLFEINAGSARSLDSWSNPYTRDARCAVSASTVNEFRKIIQKSEWFPLRLLGPRQPQRFFFF